MVTVSSQDNDNTDKRYLRIVISMYSNVGTNIERRSHMSASESENTRTLKVNAERFRPIFRLLINEKVTI